MKRYYKLGIALLVIGLGIGGLLYGADADKPADKKDEDRTSFIQDDEAKSTRELLGYDATRSLYRVVVDTFEEAGEWYASMPGDQGLAVSRRHLGAPAALKKEGAKDVSVPPDKASPPRERKADGSYQSTYYPPYKDEKKYILGVRVDFFKRGHNWFAVYPYRPVKLEGVVKSFELWVCGRQKSHSLSIIIDDAFGKEHVIPMGKLNFLGWKRMFVNVPEGVIQYDYRFSEKRGITFKGLLIQTNPLESYGKYYIYFDNLTAEISRFWEEYRDQKDPVDNW